MGDIVEPPDVSLTDRNAELMGPLTNILRTSNKDAPTKVGVLVDLAAAILATLEPMRDARELRLTSEEMRKRLIHVTRLHQADIAARQEKATATLDRHRQAAPMGGFPVVKVGERPD